MFVKFKEQDHCCETNNATFTIVYSKPGELKESIILQKSKHVILSEVTGIIMGQPWLLPTFIDV